MVEPGRLFPATFAVAVATIATQRFLVLVIFAVTTEALLAGLHLEQWLQVAILARSSSMFSAQCISGVDIVAERGGLPLLGAVATFALLSEIALVAFLVVFFPVATNAGLGGIFVAIVLVTVGAFGVEVFSS